MNLLKIIQQNMLNRLVIRQMYVGSLSSIGRHAMLSVLLFLLLLSGCQPQVTHDADLVKRQEVDSLLGTCRTKDDLLALKEQFDQTGNTIGKVAALRKLGDLSRNESKFDQANSYHMEGLGIAVENRDTIEIVKALNNIATNYRRLGFVDIATNYHYQALVLTKSFSDSISFDAKKNRLKALNGLGNIFLSIDNYSMADSIFRLSLKGEGELGSALGQAINYANLGAIYEATGEIDSAWVYYRHSMEKNVEAGSTVGITLCHTHFGELYERAGQYVDALNEYDQAYQLSKESEDDWHSLETIISMARVNHKLGRDGQAFDYLTTALQTAREIKSLEHQSAIYGIYYQIYRDKGNNQFALESHLKADALRDSIFDLKRMNEIQNVRVNVERKRQADVVDAINQSLANEKSNKRMAWLVALLMLVLGLTFSTLLFLLYRERGRKIQLAQELNGMRDRFFTNLTHEFRTPLTVIQSASEELKDITAENIGEVAHQANIIEHHGKALLQMVNQMLDVAKLRRQSTPSSYDWSHGDIVPFVRMVCECYAPLAKSNEQRIDYQSTPEHIEMDFIAENARKILSNLLGNSLKFAYPDSVISLRTKVDGDHLLFTISDHGVGINKEHLPHVFEPFYRAHSSSLTIGTGIGLAMVKLAVDSMNGTIAVESEEKVGTTFTIRLPLKQKGVTTTPVSEADMTLTSLMNTFADADKPQDQTHQGATLRALIVEDSADVAKYIACHLGEGYNISFAEDGVEGYEKARQLVPDIIITDVMMPRMDGMELCRRIRSDELINHVPVVMVTAKVTQRDREQGLEAGADAYMEKPFEADELRLRVRKLLEIRQLLADKYSEKGGAEETGQPAAEPIGNPFLEKFTQLVCAQMDNGHVSITDIANEMCVTREQLSRKIKATTGITASSLVTSLRMDRACRLLSEQPEMQVMEVSLRCGISDVSYFTSLFRKQTGLTPSQYRENEQN